MNTSNLQVRLAKQWKSVPEQKKCSVQWDHPGTLSIQGKSSQTSIIHVKGCDDVDFLEHVQAHVTLAASKRGDVEISLTSPKGTKSLLIAKRPKDYSRAGFTDWPFLTVRSIHIPRHYIIIARKKCNLHLYWVQQPHVRIYSS